MRRIKKMGGMAAMVWALLLLAQCLIVSTSVRAVADETFTRTGKYKYSESESMASMRQHVREIIIQDVLQSEVGGYSQSLLSVEKQESTIGGGVRSSSMQSITQILAGYTKYNVVKGSEHTDDVYFHTTAEVTVDREATRRKLDEIAAERKKEEQERSQIVQRKQEALEREKAALEREKTALSAQNSMLQQQAELHAKAVALAEDQARLDRERLAAQQSIAAQKALLEQQAALNAQAKALADEQEKMNRAWAATAGAAPMQSGAVAHSGVPANFVYIRGGTFTMGSPENEVSRSGDEGQQHQVRLSDFYMGKYEVTVGEFRQFVEDYGYSTDAEKGDGSYVWDGNSWVKKAGINWRHGVSGQLRSSSEENHPVVHVSWNDAVEYCKWLSFKTGKSFRLPTEAEWEYACRAGTRTPFNTGYNLTTSQANYHGDYPYNNNQKGIYRGSTLPVNSLAPNSWGLYNMHGNVWEWCSDWFKTSYYAECKARGTVSNPDNQEPGSYRVLRGGSWGSNAEDCRSACRYGGTPGARNSRVGFRLVFVP